MKPSNPRQAAYRALCQYVAKPDSVAYEVLQKQGGGSAANLTRRCLHHLNFLDHLIITWSARPLVSIDARARAALWIGLTELLLMDTEDYAAVSQAVDLIPIHEKGLKAFTNAILRRAGREGCPTFSATPEDLDSSALAWRHPRWLIELWLKHYSFEQVGQICSANLESSPLGIRVNRLHIDAAQIPSTLKNLGEGFVASPWSPYGFSLRHLPSLGDSVIAPLWKSGAFYFQNVSAQLPALLLEPQATEYVVDLFAAPGGKSTQLAEMMNGTGRVIAVDHNRARRERILENQARLKLTNIELVAAKVESPEAAAVIAKADAVLLDPPCSAFGTLRRNPEIKWLKTQDDLQRLATSQTEWLTDVFKNMRPGARGVYSVCTFGTPETAALINHFAQQHPNFKLIPVTTPMTEPHRHGPFLEILPSLGAAADGYFIAKFSKDAS